MTTADTISTPQLADLAALLEERIMRNFQVIPTLTLSQAAEAVGVSDETMRKLCAEGKIPHIKLDRLYRIKPADLNSYLEQHYQKGKKK